MSVRIQFLNSSKTTFFHLLYLSDKKVWWTIFLGCLKVFMKANTMHLIVPSFLFFFCYLYWDDSTVYPRVTCRKYTKILVFSRIQPSISPLKIYYRLSIFNLTKSLILNFVILRSSPQVLVNFKIDVPDVVMVMSTKIKFIISITPPLYLGFE